jgi:hypothetical protein
MRRDRDRTEVEAAKMPPAQAVRLESLIRAAGSAREAAECGLLFASTAGCALVNAAFDLFECDDLYRLGEDVEHELGRGGEA